MTVPMEKQKLLKLMIRIASVLLLLLILLSLLGGKLLPDPELSEQDKALMIAAIQRETETQDIDLLESHTQPGKLIMADNTDPVLNRHWRYAWQPKRAMAAFSDAEGTMLCAAVFQYDGKEKNWTLLQSDSFPMEDNRSVTALLDYEECWGCSVLLTNQPAAEMVRYSYLDPGIIVQTSRMGLTGTNIEGVLTELDEGYFGGVNVFDAAGEIVWTTDTESGVPYPYEELQLEAIQTGLREAGLELIPELGTSNGIAHDELDLEMLLWTAGEDMGISLLEVTRLDEGCGYTHLESHLFRGFLLQDTPFLHLEYYLPGEKDDDPVDLFLNCWEEVRELHFTPAVEGMEDFKFTAKVSCPDILLESDEGTFILIGQDGSELDFPELNYICTEAIPGEHHSTYIYELQ